MATVKAEAEAANSKSDDAGGSGSSRSSTTADAFFPGTQLKCCKQVLALNGSCSKGITIASDSTASRDQGGNGFIASKTAIKAGLARFTFKLDNDTVGDEGVCFGLLPSVSPWCPKEWSK